MCVDVLILVTTTSRKTAWNINLCFPIYASLSGQLPNSSKSQIIFPFCVNRRVFDSIWYIMNFDFGFYPLNYL